MINNEVRYFFNQNATSILVYPGKEVEIDPREHVKEIHYLQPKSVKAIVTDLIATQLQWKLPGIQTSDAKILVVDKTNRTIIESSRKIRINNIDYVGWRDKVGGKMQIKTEGDFISIYIYRE